jgi:hypothetical protein
MTKVKTSRIRKKAIVAKDFGVYISLLTDFGFKEVMINFRTIF